MCYQILRPTNIPEVTEALLRHIDWVETYYRACKLQWQEIERSMEL